MAGVKKIVVRINSHSNELWNVVGDMSNKYNTVAIYYNGSVTHKKHNLTKDFVLVKGWNEKCNE